MTTFLGSTKTMKSKGLDSIESWLIAGACCAIYFLQYGCNRVSGLLFAKTISTYGVDRQTASIPYTLGVTLRHVAGPLSGYLGHRLGIRLVVMLGAVLSSIGLGVCHFADDVLIFEIFWGVFYGVGCGLATCLLPKLVDLHFRKHAGKAYGITYAGSSLAGLVLPLLIEILLDNHGLQFTLLIMSGLMLHCIPASMLLRDGSTKTSKHKTCVDDNEIKTDRCCNIKSKVSVASSIEVGKIRTTLSNAQSLVNFEQNRVAQLNEESHDTLRFANSSVRNRNCDTQERMIGNLNRAFHCCEEDISASKTEALSGDTKEYTKQPQMLESEQNAGYVECTGDQKIYLEVPETSPDHSDEPSLEDVREIRAATQHHRLYQCHDESFETFRLGNENGEMIQNDVPNDNSFSRANNNCAESSSKIDHENDSFLNKISMMERNLNNESQNRSRSKSADIWAKRQDSQIELSVSVPVVTDSTNTRTDIVSSTDIYTCDMNTLTETEKKLSVNTGLQQNNFLPQVERSRDLKKHKTINNEIHPQKLWKISKSLKQDLSGCFQIFNILWDPEFLVISFTESISVVLMIVLPAVLIDYAADKGIPVNESTYLLMDFALCDLVSSVLFSMVTDAGYMSRTTFGILCYVVSTVAFVCIALSQKFWMLCCSVGLAGSCLGAISPIFPGMVTDYIPDKDKQTMAISSVGLLFVPMNFCTSPLIGFFRDTLGSYDGLIYCFSASSLLCCILLFLLERFYVYKNKGV